VIRFGHGENAATFRNGNFINAVTKLANRLCNLPACH